MKNIPSKLLKNCLILIVFLGAIAIVANYNSIVTQKRQKKITYEELTKQIEIDNNFKLIDKTIEIKSDRIREIIKISNDYVIKNKLKNIKLNDKILTENKYDQFYISNDNNYIKIQTEFNIKPSKNKLSFVFDNINLDYNFTFIYASNDDFFSNEYWYQNPENWVTKINNGILLTNIDEDVKSLGFRRRFEKNVRIEFDLIPVSSPINLSIYFGEGTSFFLGTHDNKSIQLIQTKKLKNKNKHITYARKSFILNDKLKYRISASKNEDNYYLTINDEKIFTYKDDSPSITKNDNFKNVGIAIWKSSSGAEISNVIVSSSEMLSNL